MRQLGTGRRLRRWLSDVLTMRRLRQLTQILALAVFLYLFVYATFLNPQRAWADLFYHLDPLVALTTILARRAWVAGFGLAAITVVVTLLFGRVWCGWICPLGTVLGWLRSGRRRYRRTAPSERWRGAKYVILLVIVVAAALGNQTLLFFDPLTVMTRTLGVALWPALKSGIYSAEAALYQLPILWGLLDAVHEGVIYPVFRDVISVFSLAVPVLFFFLALVALNWWAERAWCRYFCPLGGLLALLSKLSFVRREVSGACAACALCTGDCPTGTIDPRRGYRSDPAECIVCYDCVDECRRDGVGFRWQGARWRPAAWREYDPARRQMLAGVGAAVAGVALAGVEPITQRQLAHLVRPPGASSPEFESLCIRCGECVRVCPTQGLQPSLFEAGVQNVLTPRLVPRLGYCDYRCNACGEVCPTGAIPPLTVAEKQTTPIGLARVDQSRCLPWAYDIPCIVCEEVCPVPHKAIWLETAEVVDAAGATLTIQRPVVVKELCIGCGICEYQCPMGGESAIRVYAPTEAGGYLGDDAAYRPHRGRRARERE
ncbi:MAG: 4Fe-4S binding protein [Anaerolineae bacterium]